MLSINKRTKRIFVSDIHMGDTESCKPPSGLHPYGWLRSDRAMMFANFLEIKLKDPEVKQVIILGDLFDEWICPTSISPVPNSSSLYNQFQKIAKSPQNVPIINALKNIAKSDNVELIYVPGNHDMLLTQDILTNIIPDIIYLGTAQGEGIFTADGISAEHGSMYCLFNAPDSYNNPEHVLPLGYFISRVVTEKVLQTGTSIHYLDALTEFIKNLKEHSPFAQAVFSSIVKASDLTMQSKIKMEGINDYSKELQLYEIEKIFSNLYSKWEDNMTNNVSKEEAVSDDTGILYPAAVSQYFFKNKSDIVIFGHTHNHIIRGILFSENEQQSKVNNPEKIDNPCKYIYANSGTWINQKKQCTYVETQISEDSKKHYVRIMEYKEDGSTCILGERYKNL